VGGRPRRPDDLLIERIFPRQAEVITVADLGGLLSAG
jgi:hypothetical protein